MPKYDCTVITGLETLAIRECEKKLALSSKSDHRDGHVYINTEESVAKLFRLKSVDNIHVVLFDEILPDLECVETDSIYELFLQIVPRCDWNEGIRVWSEAYEIHTNNVLNAQQQLAILNRLPTDSEDADKCWKPRFRVSCNRSGTHKFPSPLAAAQFGGALNDYFLWPVGLSDFDLKVQISITQNRLVVAIQLTTKALFKRFIVDFGSTTLRGTIAYALLQIADPQPGDIVCDPMCGSGVIPIEAAHDWSTILSLGSDCHEKAMAKTAANVAANPLPNLNILQLDITRMPYRNGCIDCFVSDLPFGRRVGSKTLNKTLYPALLREMLRCCTPGTGRIVWLTQDRRNANACFSSENPMKQYFFVVKSVFVKVGGLEASIYLLKRNTKPFVDS